MAYATRGFCPYLLNLLSNSRLIIFTIALASCSNGSTGGSKPPATETPTARSSGTEKKLSFGTNCKVTIKSDDKFTNAEWNTLCDKVVAAIMRGYNKNMGSDPLNLSNKGKVESVFAGNITIDLSSSAAYNCEVKSGNYTTIYLKTSAVDTVDLQPAVVVIDNDTGSHQD
jgi:hypothetical protein